MPKGIRYSDEFKRDAVAQVKGSRFDTFRSRFIILKC